MTNPHNTEDTVDTQPKPTQKQLRYLRQLADRLGQTFTYPQTMREASSEIARLKRAASGRDHNLDRHSCRIERREVAADFERLAGGDARYRDHELEGHGSTATWSEVA